MIKTDTTFFTNEPGSTLHDRFKDTLKHVKYFDVLVGYFRTSGFHLLYDSLKTVKKIRILVGLNLDQKSYDIIEESRKQSSLDLESHKRTKESFSDITSSEMDISEDNYKTEMGIKNFLNLLMEDCEDKDEDIKNGGNGKRLEFKAYPSEDIHAKVYISRYDDHISDVTEGSVITGSSNFSKSGLEGNREFNVELKDPRDLKFALDQFENLWIDSVDISKEYIDTITEKTWLNESITPYELYIKMLYEYFKEDINLDQEFDIHLPDGFMDLEYQKQAVLNAKKILDAYNGVFLADVVGLGKTYISALLAQQLPGGKLVICPPVLKDYWEETFFDFRVAGAEVESMGKIDKILNKGVEKYDYIFIDEAHRFRNEYTQSFEIVQQICHQKKVILVSATPLNNRFSDIFSQVRLFQSPKKSTLPGIINLETFFNKFKYELKKFEENKASPQYLEAVTTSSEEIREKLLRYIMVRRTRHEVVKYFSKDIKEQGLTFPKIADPRRIIYKFDTNTGIVFHTTIGKLKEFNYSRYTPVLFLRADTITEFDKQSQKNIGGFMKGILVKRLESSFYAFKKTLGRFITSYDQFIEMYKGGEVLISKKVNVYDLLYEDNEEQILKLIELEKLTRYKSTDFNDDYLSTLEKDRDILISINNLWKDIEDDPKIDEFIKQLKTDPDLKDEKVLIFTESKETGDHLFNNLNTVFEDQVYFYYSGSGISSRGKDTPTVARDYIKQNYDPNSKNQTDDFRILITTDVLAEGINLHRSNKIINYDLPWNPTRVLQRVGRVNRVGSQHSDIHIYNFFPTDESDEELNLEANIISKIQAFHNTLGEDAKYLSNEEEIEAFDLAGSSLYNKLNDSDTYEDEDDDISELQYLQIIRDVRDDDNKLFQKVKNLPKKGRTAKISSDTSDKLITFFRKDKLKKFVISDGEETNELTFFDAVEKFKCEKSTRNRIVPKEFYDLLDKNKNQFDFITTVDNEFAQPTSRGRSNESYVIGRLKAKELKEYMTQKFTDVDENYIKRVLRAYDFGHIPKNTSKSLKKKIETEADPHKILAILKKNIPETFLTETKQSNSLIKDGREVILSEYLVTDK